MHIYLAPHHDDVCFSVGELASQTGGALLNAFTISRYVAAPVDLPDEPDAQVALISNLRRQEDLRFTGAAGLARHDLGLSEPPVLGLKPFDLSGIADEVRHLSARLIPLLLDLLPRGGDPRRAALYCPMGIGGHRNHLSMLLAVRGAYPALAQRCAIFLYEDLHYASNARARQQGLALVAKVFAGAELSPIVMALDPLATERKMRLVSLYASQHAQPPQLTDFTPASGLSPGPHEIVWRVSRPSHFQP
jgi:hypothetical protein